MARNGSGTYNRAVSPYTAGTTIAAGTVNQEMDDIATALTGSMARDGQSLPTANIPMGGFRITGLANAVANTDAATLSQVTDGGTAWVDLASAATTDIGAQTSNSLRLTGTTTITSFGTAASGVRRRLRIATGLTITHNAASLICPGAANLVLLAGDVLNVDSLGSGNWVVTDLMPANGWRGAPVVLAEAVASASATLDITGAFSDTFDRYELELIDLVPATNNVTAWLRVGTGAGPTWQAGAGAYNSHLFTIGTSSNITQQGPASQIGLSNANQMGNIAGGGISGLIRFYNPDATKFPRFETHTSTITDATTSQANVGGGAYLTSGAITGLRVMFSSGNIASGSIRLIGYRK